MKESNDIMKAISKRKIYRIRKVCRIVKIERLIGILSILLQKEKVTAPFLAEKFEVSRRTINRDIDDLCMAGIPIVTTRGQNGGISIMEGYKLDRTLLTSSDMQAMLAGLKGLDSIASSNKYQQLMDKLSVENDDIVTNNHIAIDLSSWYGTALSTKIDIIGQAIGNNRYIKFMYYNTKEESTRTIEPYLLVFHWSSWYVWGYCIDRKDYRLFKLGRVQNLEILDEKFSPRETPKLQINHNEIFHKNIEATVLVEPTMKWRLIDEYGIDCFESTEDGKLRFCGDFTDKESLFRWVLSFGRNAKILEPEELKAEFYQLLIEIKCNYET